MVAPLVAAGVRAVAPGLLAKAAKSKLGKKLISGTGKLLGMKGAKASTTKKRRGFSYNRYVRRLVKAKLDAKIMKTKLSVVKGL